jgi:hypothetical protein
MALSKHRGTTRAETRASVPDRSPDAGSVPPAVPPTAGRRAFLIVVSVVFSLWVALLAWLTATSANPPLLNPVQLSRARHIVEVEVEDRAAGTCRVVRSWTPGDLPGTITVVNLADAAARTGGQYVLPLVSDPLDPKAYRIVDDPEHDMPPYIYPAGPEITRQLEAR